MKISSYISIFDDWELLKPSLWSIDALVDEIVVVDGAYDWMARSIQMMRGDPTRSSEEVYDVLAAFGSKVKVINGLWRNETQKRQAGFEACSGRFVLRNDADEILFWNADNFEKYLQSGRPVGQMEMPIYVCPGKVRAASPTSPVERQSFLFDTAKITSSQHLSYLWLVLPPDERASLEASDPQRVFADPVAFTAHLTHWRSPQTAVNRARFYVMNYIRSTGALPWLKAFRYTPEGGFDELFRLVSPEAFQDILMGDAIVASPPNITSMMIRPSGLPTASERVFAMLYDNMLDGLARLNDDLCGRPRTIVNGVRYFLDASQNRSLARLQKDGVMTLKFSANLQSAAVALTRLFDDGSSEVADIDIQIDGNTLQFSVPRLTPADRTTLRRTLSLTARFRADNLVATFKAIR